MLLGENAMENMHLLLSFLVSLAVIIAMIMSKKFNPSFCLFVGAIVAALIGGIPIGEIAGTLNSAFGSILISTGLLMLFAFIFCQYLSESGGILEFAKALLRVTGPKYDLVAVAIIGYILSIPVGFLASCAIVIPMFKPMSKMTGRPMQAYVCSFIVPTLLTACTVVPTSGPVAFAGLLGIDIGFYMVYGILITLPGAVISTLIVYWMSARLKKTGKGVVETGSGEMDLTPDPTKPKASLVLLLILIPIITISVGAFAPYIMSTENVLYGILSFIGNTGISMFVVTVLSMVTLRKYLPRPSTVIFNEGVKEAGPIFAMLGCAQCYGSVLQAAGVGDYIVDVLGSTPLPVLVIALILMVALHAGTGAGTVAGTTTISLLMPMFESTGTSLMLFGLVAGIGQLVLLIPTDVTFWYIKDASGLSVGETAKSVCIPATIVGLIRNTPGWQQEGSASLDARNAVMVMSQMSKVYFTHYSLYEKMTEGMTDQPAKEELLANYVSAGMEAYADGHDANCVITCLRACNSYSLANGFDSLDAAFARLSMPALVISVDTDPEFPPHYGRELVDGINAHHPGRAEQAVVHSIHGHMGCVLEADQLKAAMGPFQRYLKERL